MRRKRKSSKRGAILDNHQTQMVHPSSKGNRKSPQQGSSDTRSGRRGPRRVGETTRPNRFQGESSPDGPGRTYQSGRGAQAPLSKPGKPYHSGYRIQALLLVKGQNINYVLWQTQDLEGLIRYSQTSMKE